MPKLRRLQGGGSSDMGTLAASMGALERPSFSSENFFGFSDRELGLPLNLSEEPPLVARTPLYARRATGAPGVIICG
jgi:hypothetical protein